MLGFGHNLEALDKGTLGIFGEGFVADDLAVFIYCHDAIGSYHIPIGQIYLEAGTESILINQTYLHFWRATSKRDESTDAKFKEWESLLVTISHDEYTVSMKDSFESLVGQYLIVLSSILQEHLESHGGIVHSTITRGVLL